MDTNAFALPGKGGGRNDSGINAAEFAPLPYTPLSSGFPESAELRKAQRPKREFDVALVV